MICEQNGEQISRILKRGKTAFLQRREQLKGDLAIQERCAAECVCDVLERRLGLGRKAANDKHDLMVFETGRGKCNREISDSRACIDDNADRYALSKNARLDYPWVRRGRLTKRLGLCYSHVIESTLPVEI